MYESHFGITSPPFQIGPDPKFYFESGAHREAMNQLRAGLLADGGFAVLSGEVGAGKTMLVRRFVGELDGSMAVVQINSSQLDLEELLAAIAHGFGEVPAADGLDAESRMRDLHRVLHRMDRAHRRALVVIDEAQHLGAAALLGLLRLVVPTALRPMPLQICLVGQPEMRDRLDSAALHDIRKWILASAHLRGLEEEETGPYIEHRLRLAGWTGVPHFEPRAHAEIHRQTGGIPRLINRLCNRLLLSRFLGGEPTIDAELVRDTSQTIHAEMGTSPSPRSLHDGIRRDPGHDGLPGASAGALWCVVAGRSDHVKAGPLIRALQAQVGVSPAVLVRMQDNDALALSCGLFGERLPPLGCLSADPAGREAALCAAIDRWQPRAVVVFGGGADAWAWAAAARRRGVATFHIDAAPPDAPATLPPPEGLADLFFCADALAHEELADAGVPAGRLRLAGSLLTDAIHAALLVEAPAQSQASLALPEAAQYALAAWGHPANIADRQVLADMLAILRDVSRDVQVVWLLDPTLAAQLTRFRLNEALAGERVTVAPLQPHAAYVDLLSRATCVLTDSWATQEEATALGVRCLTFGRVLERQITSEVGSNTPIGLSRALATRWVWDCLFNGGGQGQPPDGWDGQAAARIANQMAAGLAKGASS